MKPGSPPDVEAGNALVADAEADSRVVVVCDSLGEYVNIGTSWLVSLAVLFSTAATVLDKTAETTSFVESVALLSTVDVSGVGVTSGFLGNALELSSVVGAGVGVM